MAEKTEFEKWLEKKNARTKKGPAHRSGKKSSSFEAKEPKTPLKRRVAKTISPEEKKEKIKARRVKQKERAARPKKTKTPEQRAVKKLDSVFSQHLHNEEEHDGMGTCFTCGVVLMISLMQAGHMWPRRYMNIRWDRRNVHLQCNDCNVVKGGNYEVYRAKFIEVYGQEEYDQLIIDRDKPFTLNLDDLKSQIAMIKAQL